jgi:transcriptional regulator with XRE-family HTH domain
MGVSHYQFRAARALLGWSQADVAAKARCSRSTVTTFENGTTTPQPRVMEDLIEVLESAGIVFIEPREGEHGLAVGLRWGFTLPQRQPGQGSATGDDSTGGMKAAWDDFEEDADAGLDALLGEAPAPDPGMADYWRTDPELWARLSEGGRETLSRTMFGDMRAAAVDYFRAGNYADGAA